MNLIDLYVSVVDAEGRPVRGLSRENFRVFEDGEEREVTNFQALNGDQTAAEEAVVQQVDGPPDQSPIGTSQQPAADRAPRSRFVAFLFDSPSLERRNRRRILEALEGFVDEGSERDDQFLVAANTGELEILRNFSSYDASILASLRRAAEMPTQGEAHKLSKRYLKRTVYRANLFRVHRVAPGRGGLEVDNNWTRIQGNTLLYQINAHRQYEAERIRRAIKVTQDLVRSMAGIEGRKSLIWVGEDLALRPAVDIYRAFYQNAAFADDILNLNVPEIWAEEVTLNMEFRELIVTAQACGVTIFIIDTSDRDREAASADFTPPSGEMIIASEAAGGGIWTPGLDLAAVRDLTEGAEYAALATGGEAYSPGRNVDAAVDTLQEQVANCYYLGYRRPGPPDGERHRVRVEVEGQGLRVRHHEQVLDRTPPQRLVDLAMSRLRLDVGLNPLDMRLELGEAEPEPTQKNRVVQPIRINVPMNKLVLLPDEESYAGQIMVAVAVIDDKGLTAPPQLLRMHLEVNEEQMTEDAVATQTIRLLMKPGTRRVAVSIRDEISGLEGSQAVAIPRLDL